MPPFNGRRIYFIHVGKCGGTSIGKKLKQAGIPFKRLHCFNSNQQIENLISNQLDNSFFLIAVRDPINRYISAFYWDLYEKIIKQEKPPNPEWTEIYTHFQNPNSLAEALSSKNGLDRTLAFLALRASKLHMHLDLRWYLPIELAKTLNKTNCHAIPTEDLNNNVRHFAINYGIAGKRTGENISEKSNYKDSIPNYSAELSALVKKNLKLEFQENYKILETLHKNKALSHQYN